MLVLDAPAVATPGSSAAAGFDLATHANTIAGTDAAFATSRATTFTALDSATASLDGISSELMEFGRKDHLGTQQRRAQRLVHDVAEARQQLSAIDPGVFDRLEMADEAARMRSATSSAQTALDKALLSANEMLTQTAGSTRFNNYSWHPKGAQFGAGIVEANSALKEARDAVALVAPTGGGPKAVSHVHEPAGGWRGIVIGGASIAAAIGTAVAGSHLLG